MRFRPESDFRAPVAAAAARHRKAIESALRGAEIEHIGSTAVPDALTKGDLDLLVRTPPQLFERAIAVLRSRYEINQPENWTSGFASFREVPEGEVAVGIQLVVAGGADDRLLIAWRDRLLADPELLERYNEFKRGQEGADGDAYIEAKGAFIEAILGERLGEQPGSGVG